MNWLTHKWVHIREQVNRNRQSYMEVHRRQEQNTTYFRVISERLRNMRPTSAAVEPPAEGVGHEDQDATVWPAKSTDPKRPLKDQKALSGLDQGFWISCVLSR